MNNTLRFTALAVATAVVVGAFAFLGTRLAQAQGGSPWDRSARMSGTVAPGMGAGYGMMGGGYRMRGNGEGRGSVGARPASAGSPERARRSLHFAGFLPSMILPFSS